MDTPASSAPIARERPARSARPLITKTQARDASSTSSGVRAIYRNRMGRTYLLVAKLKPTRAAPWTTDSRKSSTWGSRRLG